MAAFQNKRKMEAEGFYFELKERKKVRSIELLTEKLTD